MEDENELIALRRKKLEALRAKGIEPFGSGFDVSGSIADVREQFEEGQTRRVAGRITAHRDMGKSHFLDLHDATGRIQIYIHTKEVGPELIEHLFHNGQTDYGTGGYLFFSQRNTPLRQE